MHYSDIHFSRSLCNMQAQLRVGPSISLAEHWQRSSPSPDRDTQALYARARGRCFNVAFTAPPRALASLVVRNFYAASLRLVQLNSDGTTRVLLDEYPLMKHAHCEDDAQNWHLIHLDQVHAGEVGAYQMMDTSPLLSVCFPTQLRSPPDIAHLASLQFYLFQPSTLFETWDLQQLTLYESRFKDGEALPNPVPNIHEPGAPKDESLPSPSMHQLMRRLSRSSLLVIDARDVREHASQILSRVQELRHLVHESS
jgi:hypothetical protein